MEHSLIPARNAQIAEALERGVAPRDLADFFDLSERYVRQVGAAAGVDVRALDERRRHRAIREAHAHWKPSPEAQRILDSIGWNLDERVPKRPRCGERDAALLEAAIRRDITLDALGQEFGITRERARQIIVRHTGLSMRQLMAYRLPLREARRRQQGEDRVRALAASDPDADLGTLASESGLTVAEVIDVLGDDESIIRRKRNTWSTGVSDDAALAEVRRVAALPGGRPLSRSFYDKHRREGSVGQVRLTQRFGTWTAACEAAGVEPRDAPRSNYTRRWTEENIVDWVALYMSHAGPRASFQGLDRWLRAHASHGAPSAQTVRNTCGKWVDALQMAAVRRAEIADGATWSIDVPLDEIA